MSKINKALEIAKKQRPNHYYNVTRSDDTEKIDYIKSRKVNVNPKLLKRNHVLTGLINQNYIDAYKILRTRVMRLMQQNNWITLGVTSSSANEGKTLTAANLAISIAMRLNYSVVLVDADLRRPNINKLFGFETYDGLIKYLEGKIDLERILVNPSIDNLLILPGENSQSDRYSELLASPKMEKLVKELKLIYTKRIIIFDLPPVLAGDDVLSFVPHLDAILFIVEDNKSQTDEIQKSIELLEGVNLLGTVLNKSLESNKLYGYY